MKKIISILLLAFVFCGFSVTMLNSNCSLIPASEAAQFKQVQAAHILVPTEAQAIQIRNEILSGANTRAEIFNNFTNAARKYSKCPSASAGGILGYFKRGEMVKEFEDTAFSIPEGQVSEPVKTQFGWHLIYVISRK